MGDDMERLLFIGGTADGQVRKVWRGDQNIRVRVDIDMEEPPRLCVFGFRSQDRHPL